MSTDESRGELGDIRRQLREITELSAEEKELSTRYTGQVASLRRDLALVQKQIEFEHERRLDLEKALEKERRDMLPEEHIETIRRREEDIRQVREEKAAMLEWLQRGVNEAQRITLQIESLRASFDQAKLVEMEFTDDTRRLQEMESRLTAELHETKERIKKLAEQRDAMQEHLEQQGSVLGVTGDIVRTTSWDIQRLEADLEKLRSRARDAETIEIAMGCMAASVRRTVHDLEQMQHAVNTGSFPPDDGYDSGEDADTTNFSPVVLTSTKAKIGRCEALLSTLWSSMKRFDQDAGTRNAANAAKHNALVQSMRDELAELRASTGKELEQMRAESAVREPQLRRFIAMRDAALKSYFEENVSGVAAGADERRPFDLISFIQSETERVRDENRKLTEMNEALRNRTESQVQDYMAVKELKREYRDLEAQRTMLSHALRTAEMSNKEMKFLLFEQAGAQRSVGGKNSVSSGRARSSPRPPWRSPTLE